MIKKIMGNMTKKRKIILLVTAVILIVIGGGYKVYADNQKVDKARNEIKKVNKDIKAVFVGSDSSFLIADLEDNKLNSFSSKLNNIINDSSMKKKVEESTEYKETMNLLTVATKKNFTENQVNSFFKEKVINGTELFENVSIVDDLEKKDIYVISDADNFKDDWKVQIDKAIDAAKKQVDQIDKAKAAVLKVFKDDKVLSTDKKLYETAKSEVDKIRNEKCKKELSNQLTKVKSEIAKKEKQDKDSKKKEAEKKAAESGGEVKEKEDGSYEVVQSNDTDNADQNVNNNYDSTESNVGNQDYSPSNPNNGNSSNATTPPVSGNTNGSSNTGSTPSNPTPPVSGGETPTPTPAPKWRAYVVKEDGTIVDCGMYGSYEEAMAVAESRCTSAGDRSGASIVY